MVQVSDEQRLVSYLNADSKYQVVPIPSPIDLTTAIKFVNDHVSERLSPEKMSKLARLAIFYDLKTTAPAFIALLKNTEKKTADYHRSAWALIALAWIGSADQLRTSQSYLHQLQERANVWESRLIMLEATEAFGPAEGTDKHRSWVLKEIERLKSQMNQYQAQNKSNEAQGVQNQIDELEEHLTLRVTAVDRSNAVRSSVLNLATDARISRLAALYLGTEPATPALSTWAGFTLPRIGKQVSAEKIAAHFATVAQQFQRPDDEGNAQAALRRARCLRAVEFFGKALNESDSQWLKTQKDAGTDLLALRPYWVYR